MRRKSQKKPKDADTFLHMVLSIKSFRKLNGQSDSPPDPSSSILAPLTSSMMIPLVTTCLLLAVVVSGQDQQQESLRGTQGGRVCVSIKFTLDGECGVLGC